MSAQRYIVVTEGEDAWFLPSDAPYRKWWDNPELVNVSDEGPVVLAADYDKAIALLREARDFWAVRAWPIELLARINELLTP